MPCLYPNLLIYWLQVSNEIDMIYIKILVFECFYICHSWNAFCFKYISWLGRSALYDSTMEKLLWTQGLSAGGEKCIDVTWEAGSLQAELIQGKTVRVWQSEGITFWTCRNAYTVLLLNVDSRLCEFINFSHLSFFWLF